MVKNPECGYNGSMYRYLAMVLLLLPAGLSAQQPSLTLRWDMQALPDLEGRLVALGDDGNSRDLPWSGEQKKELTGSKTWTWNAPRDVLRFLVINKAQDDEFADWAGYEWLDWVEVIVNDGTSQKKITPPPGAGAVWHVGDILPGTGDFLPAKHILPRSEAIFGHVIDATTGLPIRGAQVEVLEGSGGRVVAKDSTNSGGLYLFFLPPGAVTLRITRSDYISLLEPLPSREDKLPLRRDFNMSRTLLAEQYRFVLSWKEYPEDLDLVYYKAPGESDSEVELALIWELTGNRAYGAESLVLRRATAPGSKIGVVLGKGTPDPRPENLMTFGQPRVRVYHGDQLEATIRPPLGLTGQIWTIGSFDEAGYFNLINRME